MHGFLPTMLAVGLVAAVPQALTAAPQEHLLVSGVPWSWAPKASVARAAAPGTAPLEFRDLRIEELLDELERRSPTAARMLAGIREARFPMTFGTFQDLGSELENAYRNWDPRRVRAVGYMAPIVEGRGGERRAVRILVALDLTRLDDLFQVARYRWPSPVVPWSTIQETETLAVLAHELVHAYGLATSRGDLDNLCPDPVDDTTAHASCAIIGENLVRSEIGAPEEWSAEMPRLSSLPGRYAAVRETREVLTRLQARPSLPPVSLGEGIPDL